MKSRKLNKKRANNTLKGEVVQTSGPYTVVRKGDEFCIVTYGRIIIDHIQSIPNLFHLIVFEICAVETLWGWCLINSNGKAFFEGKYFFNITVINEKIVILKEKENGLVKLFFPTLPLMLEGKISQRSFDSIEEEDFFIRTRDNELEGAYTSEGLELLPPEYKEIKIFDKKSKIIIAKKQNDESVLMRAGWSKPSQPCFGFYYDFGVINGFIQDNWVTIDIITGKTVNSKKMETPLDPNTKIKRVLIQGIDGETRIL